MSWRWIVDARGDKVEVDWPRLAAVLAAAALIARFVFWLLPSPLDYGILVIYAGVAIWIDTRLRRGHGS